MAGVEDNKNSALEPWWERNPFGRVVIATEEETAKARRELVEIGWPNGRPITSTASTTAETDIKKVTKLLRATSFASITVKRLNRNRAWNV
eukprot:SAG31_NODE_6048_length_2192_cov_2.365504_2_plen_91_part_00